MNRAAQAEADDHTGLPVLRLSVPFAVAAIVTVILGRAVGPSLAGAAVGMDRLISLVERAGWIVSQVFAMAAMVLAMAEILLVSRVEQARFFRVAPIVLGGIVVFVSCVAAPRREALELVPVAFMGTAASLMAVLAALRTRPVPITRSAAAIVGFAGLASLVRLVAVALAFKAAEPAWSRLVPLVRGVATIGFVLNAAALLLSIAWIASRSRSRGVASPATIAMLATAMLLTRQALHGGADDAGTFSVVVRRAAATLLTDPAPLVPLGLQMFVAMLAPLAAVFALTASRSSSAPEGSAAAPVHPAIGAPIALALLVRDSPEMPLGALVLLIAGLTLMLVAHDERGLWSAIVASSRPRAP